MEGKRDPKVGESLWSPVAGWCDVTEVTDVSIALVSKDADREYHIYKDNWCNLDGEPYPMFYTCESDFKMSTELMGLTLYVPKKPTNKDTSLCNYLAGCPIDMLTYNTMRCQDCLQKTARYANNKMPIKMVREIIEDCERRGATIEYVEADQL